MTEKLPWKKVLTREYTFLYANYAADAFKIMKKLVGTTLDYDFFYGEEKLLTIYRIEKDIQNSYKMIEKISKRNPDEIIEKMDKFDELIRRDYELFGIIKKTKDRKTIKKLLIELDKTFLYTLCYYLFFVYLGYAGNLPANAKFLKKHSTRFAKIRTYTIDTDMNREYPILFGKYNKKLKTLTSYMTRAELLQALYNQPLNLTKINNRKKRYLVIMKKHKIKEFEFIKIDTILNQELAHLNINSNQNYVKGQIACKGKAEGTARIVFTKDDYKKIKKGDILITPMTKPNIVPFLSVVNGIVANDGGALSHASIISREMNIPCIVGTIHATDIFKNGDHILLDANIGEAKKINKNSPK
jgi:phosphoenolpyruvate synthase/pyruvate phosphate dikinase